MNRLYGSRLNPLHHSGAIVVALLGVLLATGLYLLLFYRIGEPYGSVERITEQAWAGRWVRTLHRYAANAAVVAVGVHALRMFSRGKSWGSRALAWVSAALLAPLWLRPRSAERPAPAVVDERGDAGGGAAADPPEAALDLREEVVLAPGKVVLVTLDAGRERPVLQRRPPAR